MKRDLSPRQDQVSKLVAKGFQDKQIADALKISEETVGHHLRKVYRRLKINSRAELAAWQASRERVATRV